MSAATPNLELPGYRIRRCIGAGGMGEVFEAVEESLDRVVAIKRLRADRVNAEAAAFGTWQARFRREARLLAAVNHPNIATVHSVLEHDGHLYMVMEYVEGRSLREALKPGPLSIEDTIEGGIAAAVAAARQADVVLLALGEPHEFFDHCDPQIPSMKP